ncbi:MAG: helix-turn-helix domain-containing protein [Saccharospirillum sp.]
MMDTPTQPIQHHLDVIEVTYPKSAVNWTAPKQEWRHFAQCLLLNAGRCVAHFKGAQLPLQAPAIGWFPAGMLLSVEFAAGAAAQLITVSEDWLIPAVKSQLDPEIPYRAMADTLHTLPLVDEEANQRRIQASVDSIRAELYESIEGTRSIVAAQLTTILTYIHRLDDDRLSAATRGIPGSTLYQRFLQLVELHFREHWKVADYASSMGVTERRLETATRRDSGQSPIILIQRKLISEACLRLAHSPLSVAEVAYGLGFKDPAYFSRFFKRNTGSAPGQWRRDIRAQAFIRDETFAAWP